MNPKKIPLLLIEDDEDFGQALILRLQKRNFDVTVAASAEEAIKTFEVGKFDVMVCDIKLPGMNEMEFMAKVREIDSDIPVIILTGYASLESAKEAVKLNAADYLLKPLKSIDELLSPIQKAIYSYRLFRVNKILHEDLKEKIRELEASEKMYRNLFESASDIIYTISTEGNIISVNNRMQEITGFVKGELIGKPITDFLAPTDHQSPTLSIIDVASGKHVDNLEVVMATKDNKKRIVEMGMRPIKENEQITGIQCIMRDITERIENRIKLENAFNTLRETQMQLIHAEKLKAIGSLASGIIHEIKNPIGIVLQGIAYLQNKSPKDQKERLDILKIMKTNIELANNIIRSLVDYSRAEKLESSLEDINEVIENSLLLIQYNVKKAKIKIEKSLKKNLPSTKIDKLKMEQVFINLCLNAIQAMPTG